MTVQEGAWLNSPDLILVDKEKSLRLQSLRSHIVHAEWTDPVAYQQLIKLSCDQLCKAENILALDADTVLTRPQIYQERQSLFNVSDERYQPYYQAVHRLLPDIPIFPYSFVSHHMVFTKSCLRGLKTCLEQRGRKWFQAILDAIRPGGNAGFPSRALWQLHDGTASGTRYDRTLPEPWLLRDASAQYVVHSLATPPHQVGILSRKVIL